MRLLYVLLIILFTSHSKASEILVTREGSNGDTAHHTAFYYSMKGISGQCPSKPWVDGFMESLWDENHQTFKRHPDRILPDFTRDQLTGLLALSSICGSENDFSLIKRFRSRNKLFFNNAYESGGEPKPWWNRDIMDPATIGLYWRAINHDTYLLYVTDFHVLLSTLNQMVQGHFDPNQTADENIQLLLATGVLKYPTPIIRLAARLYFTYRSDNDGGKGWKGTVRDFWDRDGTYLPEVINPTLDALTSVELLVVPKQATSASSK